MFESKLFRYKEFTIPFAAYRAGELSREDFLQIVEELKEIQHQQHTSLLESLEKDTNLTEKEKRIHQNLRQVVRLFDEALEITESALCGPKEDEEEQFEDAMEVFKKGNLILADAHYELDEMVERSEFKGMI